MLAASHGVPAAHHASPITRCPEVSYWPRHTVSSHIMLAASPRRIMLAASHGVTLLKKRGVKTRVTTRRKEEEEGAEEAEVKEEEGAEEDEDARDPASPTLRRSRLMSRRKGRSVGPGAAQWKLPPEMEAIVGLKDPADSSLQ